MTSTMPADSTDLELELDPTAAMRKALAERAHPGENRFWRVVLRKARTNPITVSLREFETTHRNPNFSREIGYDFAIADVDSIVEKANDVLTRVSNYHAVIGDHIGGTE